MASGTITLERTGSGYLQGQIVWSSVSNGSAANTSTVTATLQIRRSALNTTTGTFKGTFTVGDVSETISWFGSLPSMEWIGIKTITATVSHNGDGNGSCYLYAIVHGPSETTMEGTYVSATSTVALDWIPRFASVASVTDFTDEENPTITYSNPAGEEASSLMACISITGAVDDVSYREIPKTGTKYTFALTEAERNTLRAAIPNSQTGKFRFGLATTIGGITQYRHVDGTMRMVNANPIFSPAVADTNNATIALTGNSSVLVALHSTASVSINAQAKKYATIASQRVEHGSVVLTGNGTLSITNNPIKFTVTDSRGFSTTQNAGNTIIPYFNPTCVIGNNMPGTDGSFSLTVSGLFYNGSFGAKTNTLTVQYRYKTYGGSYGSWKTFATVTKNGNNYTATANLTGLDYQTVYVFQARVIDSIHTGGINSGEKAVISTPVFDWGPNDFRFNVPVTFTSSANAYAPDGYGLGDINGVWLSSSNDLNTIVQNGAYQWTDSTPQNAPNSYCKMRVWSGVGGQYVTQEAATGHANYKNVIMRRHLVGSTWSEWEYENPPLVTGEEYRTTERCDAKAVYVMRFSCGSMPNNQTLRIGLPSKIRGQDIIHTALRIKTTGASMQMAYGADPGYFIEGNNIALTTSGNFSAYTATATVKYTKN